MIWGGFFGVILALEASGFEKVLKKWPRPLQHVYTLMIVMIGWVIFRIQNPQEWIPFFRALAGGNGFTNLETLRSLNILFYIPILVVAILLCFPLLSKAELRIKASSRMTKNLVDLGFFALFLLAISYILSNGFQVFMYAQF